MKRFFEAVEVFATRSHFDYHDPAAIRSLSEWLAESQLALHSIHAPITDVIANGRGQRTFSTATRDNDARTATLQEIAAALNVAATAPFTFLVVHLGVPVAQRPGPDENSRDAAIRSVEEIHGMAEPLGVQVALEVMGNSLSTAPGLIEILERRFEGTDLGICMDVGHLVPFQGSLNWAATVMAFEKIGYDGVLMYEVRDAETPRAVLAKAVSARRRLEGLMVDSSQLSADRF